MEEVDDLGLPGSTLAPRVTQDKQINANLISVPVALVPTSHPKEVNLAKIYQHIHFKDEVSVYDKGRGAVELQ